MGRPLYSRAFKTTPAVREPEPPSYEKWSYLNAFDPDSDEFFDNENAVYEDFIDPAVPANPEDEEEEEEDRDMVIVRNASPILSDGSLSDSDSTLAVGADDPMHPPVDAFRDIRQIEEEEFALAVHEPPVRVRLATRSLRRETQWGFQMTDSIEGRSLLRRELAMGTAAQSVAHLSHPQRDASLSRPIPSTPIPVPTVSRGTSIVDERALPSSSTPPRRTPMPYLSMSPPPATTPRLYSWAPNQGQSTSPSSGGPFTNPHARTSYAHLSPALIRIRDVTV